MEKRFGIENKPNSENQNSSIPEPKTPLEILEDLRSQYKSINDIPDEELEKIGYKKIIDGGVTSIRLKEKIKKEKQDEKEKEGRAPFGVIPIEVQTTLSGRRMSVEDLESIFYKHLDQLNNLDLDWDASLGEIIQGEAPKSLQGIYGGNSPIIFLLRNLLTNKEICAKICDGFESSEADYKSFIAELFIAILNTAGQAGEKLKAKWEQIMDFARGRIMAEAEGGGEEILSHEDTEEIYFELEQFRGKLSDPDFYQGDFQKNLHRPIKKYDEHSGSEKGIGMTSYELSKYIFSQMLGQDDDLREVARQLEVAETHTDFLNILSKITLEKSEEEKGLILEMKTAGIEEKREKSSRLKLLREKREAQIKLLIGMKEFYSAPEMLAVCFDKMIKATQAEMVHGSSRGTKGEFILDGRPNKALDRDPGKVSGDCTEGQPLPFLEPRTALHNIKVFRNETQHIGNVYLLMTNTVYNEPVWHLDAIQIPANINWQEFINNFFDSLVKEAGKKGIFAITVSKEPSQISNYDYIQSAVMEYCEKIKAPESMISIPDYSSLGEKYSEAQCSGAVFLIPVPLK